MRRIRAAETERNMLPTPAIALSAFADEKHRQEALQSGFQTFLAKPARTNRLLAAIAECLPGK